MKEQNPVPDRPVPSSPDRDSEPGVYDEPDPPVGRDAYPDGTHVVGSSGSPADIRLQVERLLARRDGVEDEAWEALAGAGSILVRLLDEDAVARDPAIHARVIAAIAQLGETSALPRLAELATTHAEPFAIRAQAINALGRLGDPAALDALAASSDDPDAALRRQTAFALGRLGVAEALPFLRLLAADESIAVAEVARAALAGEPAIVRTSGSGEPAPDEDGSGKRS